MLIAGLVVILLLIAISIWLWYRPAPVDPTLPPVATSTAEQIIAQLPPPSAERLEQERAYPLGVRQLAFSFTERFGSYSSDLPYKNLDDLESLMTSKMQNSIRRTVGAEPVPYEGISTVALSSKSLVVAPTTASVVIQTQRTRSTADGQVDIFYQDLKLDFVKANSDWLVDNAQWQ
jgi:hypothetical protein